MSHAERADAWAALASAALPTGALVALLKAFGSPGAVLGAPQARIAAIVGAEAAARLAAPDPERSRATRAWLDDPAHRLLAWDDEAYPRPLFEIVDPPPVLFAIGRLELLARPSIAIVGSRQATPQGRDDARAFARAPSPKRGSPSFRDSRRASTPRPTAGRSRRPRRPSPSWAPDLTACTRRASASSRTRSPRGAAS